MMKVTIYKLLSRYNFRKSNKSNWIKENRHKAEQNLIKNKLFGKQTVEIG